ncbi:hypothetical protein SAMN04490248_10676 [Salinihabitans flavidus]|uniref:VOC domain-containing protein n=2 Tax=Salinihabitans flavidus TaxID=569882 RepID=A0A1H8QA17_9RHOB|nr:hypothetical protein SAMN04490248_10676 [Salinihabitans flavidus]
MPHFESHAGNGVRTRAFHADLFGWSFSPMVGGEEIGCHLIDGRHIGGPMTVVVDDCDARNDSTLRNDEVEALPQQDEPGIARCAYVEIGDGNVLGTITPEGNA